MDSKKECSGIGCDGCKEYYPICNKDHREEIEKLISIIRDNQWNSFNVVGDRVVIEDQYTCPECNNTPNEGHSDDCRIGLVVNEETP